MSANVDILVNGTSLEIGLDSSASTTVDLVVGGTPVEIDFDSPVLELDFETPVLEFDLDTPQLVFPVSGTGGGASALQMIFGETPNGIIDGVNKNYTSTYPYSSNKLAVFLNGLRQRRPDDYSETGIQSFRFVNAPLPGDSLSIDYLQL